MKAAIVPKIGVCHWMMLIRLASANRRQRLYTVLHGACLSSARLEERVRVGLLDVAPDVHGPAPGCPSVRFRQPTPEGAIIWPLAQRRSRLTLLVGLASDLPTHCSLDSGLCRAPCIQASVGSGLRRCLPPTMPCAHGGGCLAANPMGHLRNLLRQAA